MNKMKQQSKLSNTISTYFAVKCKLSYSSSDSDAYNLEDSLCNNSLVTEIRGLRTEQDKIEIDHLSPHVRNALNLSD